jgi:putative transposase
VHFTPTYTSWLNQVEIWCNRITQQAIRRGTFRSVKDLVEKIDHYVKNSNRQAQPFLWTATADAIFAKVERRCERISGTAHEFCPTSVPTYSCFHIPFVLFSNGN